MLPGFGRPAGSQGAEPVATQQAAQTPAAQQSAAEAQDQTQDIGPTLKLGVNEVDLIFTVTYKHGHSHCNLKQSDFALLDDQKAPAKGKLRFDAVQPPLRVGIVH